MKQIELTLQERIAIFVETKRDFVLVPSHRFLDQHDIPRFTEEEVEDVDIYHSALCIVLSSQLGIDIDETEVIEVIDTPEKSSLEINVKLTGKNEWIPVKFGTVLNK